MPRENEKSAAFGYNPNLARQGKRSRALAAQRGVNALPDPLTYAAVQSFLGTAPDELGFSAMHPQRAGIMKVAEPAFWAGTVAGVAPVLGPLGKFAKAVAESPSVPAGSKAAQRGAIYWGAPHYMDNPLNRMARAARAADPEKASVEFALTGPDARLVRGVERGVPSELLEYDSHPVHGNLAKNVHTHGFEEMSLPSFEDLAEWKGKPPQSALGVLKLKPQGGHSWVIADLKKSAVPTEKDIVSAQQQAVRRYGFPSDVEDFEYDLGKWKWLLDKAKADDIDLYLRGIEPPRALFPEGVQSLKGYDPYEIDRAVNVVKPSPELKPVGGYAGYDILGAEEPFRVYHGTPRTWASDKFRPMNRASEYGDRIGQNLGDFAGPHATLDTGLATLFSRGIDPVNEGFLLKPRSGSNIRAYKPQRIIDLPASDALDDYGVLNEALFKIAGSNLDPADTYKLPYQVKKKIIADAVRNAEAQKIDALRYVNTGEELTRLPEYTGGRNAMGGVNEKSFMLFPHVKPGFKRGGLAQLKECSCHG